MVTTGHRSLPLSGGQVLWLLGPGAVIGLAVGLAATLLAGTVVGIPAAFRLLSQLPRLTWRARPSDAAGDDPRMPGLC